ncbi:hypothetical protein BHE74_00022675 [Ensete ventricosum]|uniref:Uncharacterized protein n=1 Tax=Ensete ventricosum TaxID=4639 RepID=A0A445MGB7_ENSVE|nr:hypothetical protein BHE74_00022675 [Ensete ventricosum]RZR73327.1 hypothetical protein BHM03_00022797 [Ensete ventricosum]
MSTVSRKNATVINFVKSHRQNRFRSNFHASSRKFKILAVPNVLAHGKSYEHGFMKKCEGHKLCGKSCFDRYFVHRLENSKYWPFPTYFPRGSHTSTV